MHACQHHGHACHQCAACGQRMCWHNTCACGRPFLSLRCQCVGVQLYEWVARCVDPSTQASIAAVVPLAGKASACIMTHPLQHGVPGLPALAAPPCWPAETRYCLDLWVAERHPCAGDFCVASLPGLVWCVCVCMHCGVVWPYHWLIHLKHKCWARAAACAECGR